MQYCKNMIINRIFSSCLTVSSILILNVGWIDIFFIYFWNGIFSIEFVGGEFLKSSRNRNFFFFILVPRNFLCPWWSFKGFPMKSLGNPTFLLPTHIILSRWIKTSVCFLISRIRYFKRCEKIFMNSWSNGDTVHKKGG